MVFDDLEQENKVDVQITAEPPLDPDKGDEMPFSHQVALRMLDRALNENTVIDHHSF